MTPITEKILYLAHDGLCLAALVALAYVDYAVAGGKLPWWVYAIPAVGFLTGRLFH